MHKKRGQIIIVVLIIVMIIGIIIPAVVYFSHHEMKWTVKETKSTRAFHLAEAGIDRGVFAMNGTAGLWKNVANGTSSAPTGMDGTSEFTDVEGGRYKIKITSGPVSHQITICAVGKDEKSDEIRGLKAIYQLEGINSPLFANSKIDVSGNEKV
ncbi:MAG: hypothetical protein CVU80_02720, partial [Elusimicrobia bacterium HGW-Elusimicrobia-4]